MINISVKYVWTFAIYNSKRVLYTRYSSPFPLPLPVVSLTLSLSLSLSHSSLIQPPAVRSFFRLIAHVTRRILNEEPSVDETLSRDVRLSERGPHEIHKGSDEPRQERGDGERTDLGVQRREHQDVKHQELVLNPVE